MRKSIFSEDRFNYLDSIDAALHTRKFFKIQDGCNNFCSYCIIPYLRGKPRSLHYEKILKNILILKDKFKEVVLTGINIGIYGKDLNIENGLFFLLESIENLLLKKNVKDFRIRLSSLKPDEIDEPFIDFIKKSKYFCPHFHLSIQNFNDKILNLMNRKYNFELIKEKIVNINENIEFAAIGADIITGFPGETEEEFIDNVGYW
jgi:threonylcarbamoyladenosine tRNA methylthiotransferase MtaB